MGQWVLFVPTPAKEKFTTRKFAWRLLSSPEFPKICCISIFMGLGLTGDRPTAACAVIPHARINRNEKNVILASVSFKLTIIDHSDIF